MPAPPSSPRLPLPLRRARAWIALLSLVLVLTLLPGAGGLAARGPAAGDGSGGGAGGLPPGKPQAGGAAGSLQLANVRVLGVPTIVVATPTLSGEGKGPTALERAKVIEGNLDLLYQAPNRCTPGERLGGLVAARHGEGKHLLPCDFDHLGLGGRPDDLQVVVLKGNGLPPQLAAVVPGRERPLPLLSVTDDDARLNGTTPQRLAERWRPLLEKRLRFARHLLESGVLRRRFRTMALLELVLGGLLFAGLGLWSLVKRRLGQLELREVQALAASRPGSPPAPATAVRPAAFGAESPPLAASGPPRSPAPADHPRRTSSLLIPVLHLLSSTLLAGVLLLLPLMVGVAVLAVPGQIPLAIDLLLQPFSVVGKLLVGWLLALLLQAVLAALLSQWNGNPSLAPERRARRNQRYRSLKRVVSRLVHLACIALVALWVVVDIPGVRDLSNNALLASGALLGALALVFQDLLRDFVAGLVLLLEDRYAIGDAITIDGLSGEVIDVDLLSTQLRSRDQRVMVIPNNQCKRVVNTTKLRSGQELRLSLAHGGADPRRALAVISQASEAFAADPAWSADLLEPPHLLGLRQVSPQGLEVALVLVTRAGRQGPLERELLLRLVEALQEAGIPLAGAVEPVKA